MPEIIAVFVCRQYLTKTSDEVHAHTCVDSMITGYTRIHSMDRHHKLCKSKVAMIMTGVEACVMGCIRGRSYMCGLRGWTQFIQRETAQLRAR